MLQRSSRLQWDATGDMLAILPAGSSRVVVWSAVTRELQQLETEFRVSCAASADANIRIDCTAVTDWSYQAAAAGDRLECKTQHRRLCPALPSKLHRHRR
jgi:hypothetical protein